MDTASKLRLIALGLQSARQTTPNMKLSRESESSVQNGRDGFEPVAIIGLSGYFPRCMSVREFWGALDEDKSLLEVIPARSFDWSPIYDTTGQDHSKTRSKWGGFIPDIRGFDPEFFGVLPGEADVMDPRQRLLLMSVFHSFQDAGYDPLSLKQSNTGVFVGIEDNEFLQTLIECGIPVDQGFGHAASMVANRISYFFDFRGPSEIVNAQCAGAAVALHRAVCALRSGEISQAVVGAANLVLRPEPFVQLSRLGQLSPIPSVRSFGKDAQGYLRAEGVVSVVLKTLSQAERDGDPIHATIRNTAVNYNGQGGSSMAAPNPAAHAALIHRCYQETGIDPRRIRYIEAQGMGTIVGDIAEWNACNCALLDLARDGNVDLPAGNCLISTLKPMTGHMHSASALGALFKIIHSLQNRRIFKILNFTDINPDLNTQGQPCAPTAETQDWPEHALPRLAGLHSYGSGGNNAHLLIEEYREPARHEPAGKPPRSGRETSGPIRRQVRKRLAPYRFQTRECWPQPQNGQAATPPTGPVQLSHPLLGTNCSDFSAQRFQVLFHGDEFFLAEHSLHNNRIFPGVGYVEMARAAGETSLRQPVRSVKNVVWLSPLFVSERPVHVQTEITTGKDGELQFEITSQNEDARDVPQIHGQGELSTEPLPPVPDLKIEAIKGRCSSQVEGAGLYSCFERLGFNYGPRFQGVTTCWLGTNETLGHIRGRGTDGRADDDFLLNPALLDSALHPGIVDALEVVNGQFQMPDAADGKGPAIPFSLKEVRIYDRLPDEFYAHCRMAADASEKVRRMDCDLCDSNGKVLVSVRGLCSRAYHPHIQSDSRTSEVLYYTQRSTPQALTVTPSRTDHTLHLVLPQSHLPNLQSVFDEVLEEPEYHGLADEHSIPHLNQKNVLALVQLVRTLARTPGQHLLLVCWPASDELHYACLPGLLRSARLDVSNISPRILSGPDFKETGSWQNIIAQEQLHYGGALHVTYSDSGSREVDQLVAIDPERPSPQTAVRIEDNGVYWVTGGLGGIGRTITASLARKPGIRLLLSGRSALSDETRSWLKQLETPANTLDYIRMDLADHDSVSACFGRLKRDHGRLDGVFHCAGCFNPGLMFGKSESDIQQTLEAKVAGTLHLDEVTREEHLQFIVLFSSLASVFGHDGHWDYAASNSFLDAFAKYRNSLVGHRERHGLTTTVNWPSWENGGMFMDERTRQQMWNSSGLRQLTDTLGLRTLGQALAFGTEQVVVLHGDRRRLETLVSQTNASAARSADEAPSQVVPGQTSEDLIIRDRAEGIVRSVLSPFLKVSPDELDLDAEFSDIGFDSILVVTASTELQRRYSIRIDPVMFFEYTTARQLTGYLCAQYAGQLHEIVMSDKPARPSVIQPEESAATAPPPLQSPGRLRKPKDGWAAAPLAIIGVAGRYPQSETLDAFWNNLVEGIDCIDDLPEDRWASHAENAETPLPARGGFLKGLLEFDPLVFNISPREAESLNPKERLFLQCVWHLLEDAGYTSSSLSPEVVGVFVGVTKSGWDLYAGSFASVANRVSYTFDFRGPSLAIDTMCSASLVAIHEACHHVRSGECDIAVAGGMHALLHPSHLSILSATNVLSPDGQCRSFADQANGMVPGEGVGAVMIRPLSEAIQHEDRILAVIRGSATNHGGKTNGYSVPNPQAQRSLVRLALERAEIDAHGISYVEAHGTGTPLGDPVEIRGLSEAFRADTPATQYCRIGSVKSNIGHLEAAAGIAGLTKVLLQLKHRLLVPSLHATQLNSSVDFEASPFCVQQSVEAWDVENEYGEPAPRIACVSSFGAGGANAHLVIEEFVEDRVGAGDMSLPKALQDTSEDADGPHLVLLSARNEAGLKNMARNLVTWLRTTEATNDAQSDTPGRDAESELVTLRDLAYTLQVGRVAMQERLGAIVDSLPGLVEKLQGFLDGQQDGLYRGSVRRGNRVMADFASDEDISPAIDAWLRKRKYSRLLNLWLDGVDLDWTRLHTQSRPRRISLPLYPFAKDYYALPEQFVVGVMPGTTEKQALDNGKRFLESNQSSDLVHATRSRASASEPAATGGERIADEDAWSRGEISNAIDWQQCFRRCAGQKVCVLYAEEQARDEFCLLLEQLNSSAVGSDRIVVKTLNFQDMTSELFQESPDVILILGPWQDSNGSTEYTNWSVSAVRWLSQYLASPASGDNVRVYYLFACHTARFGLEGEAITELMSAAGSDRMRHSWKSVTYHDEQGAATGHQLLLRECLSDVMSERPSAIFTGIHYARGERFVTRLRELGQQSAPAGPLGMPPPCEQELRSPHLLRKQWSRKPARLRHHQADARSTLILVNADSLELADDIVAALETEEVILVGDVDITMPVEHTFDNRDSASGRQVATRLKDALQGISRLIDLSDLYRSPRDTDDVPFGRLTFYQKLLGTFTDIDIVHVTKGLQSFRSSQMSLAGSKFTGLVKMLSAEYRHVRARSVDIDQPLFEEPAELARIIFHESQSDLEETEICYREGKRFVPSLEATEVPTATDISGPPAISKEGVYVISGGTNGVGLEIARALVSSGAQNLVLMGITSLPPRDEWEQTVDSAKCTPYLREKLKGLIELDHAIPGLHIYTGPLTDIARLENYFSHIREAVGSISGVVHSAGLYSDPATPAFVTKDAESIQTLFEPKVTGLENLYTVFSHDALDFFVSFSSLTGLIPKFARGVSDYGMANAFTDFFMAYQFHQHGKTACRTITWSDWNETGAASRVGSEVVDALKENLGALGFLTFSNQEGYDLFARAIGLSNTEWVLLSFLDLERFERAQPRLLFGESDSPRDVTPSRPSVATGNGPAGVNSDPLLSTLDQHLELWERNRSTGRTLSAEDLTDVISLDRIKQLDPDRVHRIHQLMFGGLASEREPTRNEHVRDTIRSTLADVLKLVEIDDSESFQIYGMDSISAMVFAMRLEKALQQPVPPSLLIDCPTVQTLSARLMPAQDSSIPADLVKDAASDVNIPST